MHRFFTQAVAVSVLSFLLTGCGSDGTGQNGDVISYDNSLPADLAEGELTVETKVSKSPVLAGEVLEITCKVIRDFQPLYVPTEIEVTLDGDTSFIEPGEASFEKAGEYQLACRTKEGQHGDDTPSNLVVKLGALVKIETSLDPAEIPGGGKSEAICMGFDVFGNSDKVNPGITASPAVGVAINNQIITGQATGEYEIACIGEKGVEIVPATLIVVVGDPVRFIASVTPDKVAAGQYGEVGCTVEDAAGNPAQSDWKVEAPEEITVSDTSIYTTVADEYQIKCKPVAGTGDEELVPATFTVEPGAAVAMLVYPKPDKDHYTLEDSVLIKHDLVDQYDNVIGPAVIDPIEVVPSGGMELLPNKDDKFKFVGEGLYTLTVNATEHPYSGQVELLCDGSGPVITITYPPRALTIDGPTNIVVTGHVQDKVSEVVSLTVNGDSVSFDADGGFNYPMELGHGMNVIRAESLDSLENLGKRFRATFYSTEFKLADVLDQAAATIDKAILVFLSQEFIDDGDHSQPPDDIATIIEQIAAGFDIAGMLPQEGIPIIDGCLVYITNVALGQPGVTLQSVDGGIHLIMTVPDLTADIDIECCYELPFVGEYCDNYYGIIYAEYITVDAYIFIAIAPDGTVDASLGPIEVDIVGLDVDIQGLLGGLFDSLVNVLVNVFKDAMLQQFQDEFGTSLPQMIEDALAGLSEGQVIELPPLIGDGDPTALTVGIGFDELAFSYDGLYLALDASITAPKGVEHSPLGVLMRDGCMGAEEAPYVLPLENEMSAGLAADFINEALYSVWYSGALVLDLTAEDLADLADLTEYGIENLSLKTDLYYAPVVQTCGTGEMLELQVGDAFLHAKFFMMNMDWDIKLYMYLVLEVAVALVEDPETGNTQIGVEIGELKVAEVDVVEVGEELKGKEKMVDDLFAGVLLPTLMEQLGGGLPGFDIPSFDLSALDPTIPEGTAISVEMEELGLVNGYLELGGKLK